jgi:alpha-L-rhamnosidase
LGHSELSIDGVKVGQERMTPGFTTYNKRVQYLVYDVTERLAKSGRHVLGAVLVDGWYGLARDPWGHSFHLLPYVDAPKLLLNLHLEHGDGSETVLVSDASWKWSQGEITRSWLCEEDIDLREKQDGWDRVGFDDGGWKPARVVKGPEGRLVCQREVPTRVREVLKPVTLSAGADGKSWLYDFSREFTGAIRFRASGPAGARVKLTILPPPGSVSCAPRANTFTLAGKGNEQYASRFCYNAIWRVLVEGATRPPALEDLDAVILSGAGEPSGSFRCSNDLVNWLHESARRTQMAYVTYLPNDPTREFKAWMEDPQNMFVSAVHLFDSRAMYERWQRDMLDCQAADGNGANVAPGPVFDPYNSTWWGGCLVWIPWHWHLYYGDPSLLFESYEAMKRYVDFLGHAGKDGVQDWGLRDWIPIEETSRALVNTTAYPFYARVVGRTAAMLGRAEDARKYEELAERMQTKFNERFLDPQTGIYGERGGKAEMARWPDSTAPHVTHPQWWPGDRPCTQAGQALPLALGLVPEDLRPKAEAALLREIAAHGNRVSSGFVATPYLLEVLADLAPEVGYAMTTAQDYPSWYSMTAGSAGLSKMAVVDHDLMQEGWSGRPALMPSLGGNIAGWHVQSLGGIRPDPAGPGFKRFMIKPNIVGDLHWVECWYDSVHGRITSNWRRRGQQLVMEVTVPANTTATVWVPAKDADSVKENGLPAAQAPGLKFLRLENGRAAFEADGGVYRFESCLPARLGQGS